MAKKPPPKGKIARKAHENIVKTVSSKSRKELADMKNAAGQRGREIIEDAIATRDIRATASRKPVPTPMPKPPKPPKKK